MGDKRNKVLRLGQKARNRGVVAFLISHQTNVVFPAYRRHLKHHYLSITLNLVNLICS